LPTAFSTYLPVHRRKSLACALSAIAVLGMTACGGAGDGGTVVARIAGVGAITKKALEHWTRVEAIVSHELVPVRPVPRGLVPDPPRYSACIAYLRSTAQQASANTADVASTALASRCGARERELQAITLNKLIAWYWTIGRAAASGTRVTDAEARRRLAEVIATHSVYGANFARYLHLTGQTMADMVFRSRVQLLEVKASNEVRSAALKLPRSLTAQARQAALVGLIARLSDTRHWVARTSCRAGYVVSACRQYVGREQPPAAS
jgi:foldase protein PrsA